MKKSKIEWPPKISRTWVLVVSAAASLFRAGTTVNDRFCANRRGPSRCRALGRTSGAENFARQPERTFSIISALRRHRCFGERPLCARSGRSFRDLLLERLCWSTQLGFPDHVRSKKRVIASLGSFEKVKLYKARHLVDMTVADNQPTCQLAKTAGRTTFKAFPSPLPLREKIRGPASSLFDYGACHGLCSQLFA